MKEHRIEQRSFLTFYLEVFDNQSDLPMGQLYDLTIEGIMIIGDDPIFQSIEYELRIELKDEIDGKNHIILLAESARCTEDKNIAKYRTGYKFTQIDKKDIKVIDYLITQFGYQIE